MREHHLVGVAALAHLRDGVDAVLERQEDVDTEPVHADVGARGDELLEVAEVGGVAGVADDDPRQVDALLGEDALLLETARVAAWVWVEIGTPVCRCACATARSTRSTPGVTPGSSVAHLRIAALMPVSAMPFSMSRTNMSVMISGPPKGCPGPLKWKYIGTSL